MGTPVTNAAEPSDEELGGVVETAVAVCVICGLPLASVLERLGSLRCHDCRDGDGSDPLGGAPSRR